MNVNELPQLVALAVWEVKCIPFERLLSSSHACFIFPSAMLLLSTLFTLKIVGVQHLEACFILCLPLTTLSMRVYRGKRKCTFSLRRHNKSIKKVSFILHILCGSQEHRDSAGKELTWKIKWSQLYWLYTRSTGTA